MRRRQPIPPRRPVFVGCEGQSEAGYVAFLARLLRDRPEPRFHVHPVILQPGAGDPLQLVQRAIQKIAELQSRRERFAVRAILLDRGAPDKDEAARRLARQAGIQLVWQSPDHEALLLRHLPGCRDLRPPSGESTRLLNRHWPGYRKGMAGVEVAQRLDLDSVRSACRVEPELRALIEAIGLL